MGGESDTSESGARRARPWIFLALWLGSQFIIALGLFLLWGRNHASTRLWVEGPQGLFVLAMVGMLAGVGIIFALQRPKSVTESRELFCLQRLWSDTALLWLFVGVVLGLIVHFVPNSWGGQNTTQQVAIRRAASEGGLAYYVIGVVLCPIPEEMIMRAYLYNSFRSKLGRPIALLLMAIFNSLFHIGNVGGSFFAAYFYAGFGALLCFIFDFRRNLIDSIACHVAYNAVIALFAVRWVMEFSR
jgi:membrane protease YdiL (CAAX protease family)